MITFIAFFLLFVFCVGMALVFIQIFYTEPFVGIWFNILCIFVIATSLFVARFALMNIFGR